MRVLIVLPGAIGDVVRALPLLGRVRRAWPEAHVGWAVEPLSAPVLAGHPWLDQVHVFARARGVRGFIAHVHEVRAARYALTLDLGRSAKSALIALGAGARRRLGFAAADGREGGWLAATERLAPQPAARSKLEQFLAFGDALGLGPAPVEFGVAATAEERERAAGLLGDRSAPLLSVPLGSSCPSRRWLPDRTAALLTAVHRTTGARAALLGTAADAGFARAVLAGTAAPAADLTGRTSLRDLIAIFERSQAVVGPDSGSLHLAAAVGCPVVSLWGATSPQRSVPWGSEDGVVVGESPCAPCFLTACPIGRVCMQAIDVDTVLGRVERALAA